VASVFIDRNAERRRHERLVSKYMAEIREAAEEYARPGHDRRDFLKAGLVAGSAGLLALAGTPDFKPHWAHAKGGDDGGGGGGLTMISPPNTPFSDPLPLLPVMQRTDLNRTGAPPTRGPNPLPSHYKGFTEAARPAHQHWTDFGGWSNTTGGFTGAMYESVEDVNRGGY
jgi:hypothetical protein